MRIDGKRTQFEDGLYRPTITGNILNVYGGWQPAPFLVDTGADRTVFSAALLDTLGFKQAPMAIQLGGIGGLADSVELSTQIRFPRDDDSEATFRGRFAAFTRLETLDICVLGRDILNMFALIVDRPIGAICLLGSGHTYAISRT